MPDIRLLLAVCLCSCDVLPLDSKKVSRGRVAEGGRGTVSVLFALMREKLEKRKCVITQSYFDDVCKDDIFSAVNTIWSLSRKKNLHCRWVD